jgi:hypothetical protein
MPGAEIITLSDGRLRLVHEGRSYGVFARRELAEQTLKTLNGAPASTL